MGQLIYFLKKNYFMVNMAAVSTLGLSTSYLGNSVIHSSLDASIVPVVEKARSRNKTPKRTESYEQYSGILSGNLLRDAEDEATDEGTVNPTDIILLGTVAGPWSLAMATIQMKGEKQTHEYPSGAKLGDHRIVYIGREYIWVKSSSGEKIKIEVGSADDAKAKDSGKNGKKDKGSSASCGMVRKVVSRDEVNRLVADPTKLYKGISMGPKMKGSKIIGYRLRRVSRKHFFYTLGARSGDVITRVNGQDFGKMERMLKIWEEIKSATKIVVDLKRKKKDCTFELIIKN